MKRWGCIILIGVLMCLMGGCRRKKAEIPVVCQISVAQEQNEQVYQEPEKMQLILNRLRSLGQCYRPEEDPEVLDSPTVTITLLRSDGVRQQYLLKADRYIRFGQGPWQQTDPGPLSELRLLLAAMSEDGLSGSPLEISSSLML